MQGSSNRSVIIISALLTLLILGGMTLAVGFHNGWLRAASEGPAPGALSARAQPTDNGSVGTVSASPVSELSSAGPTAGGNLDEITTYRRKLDEAYLALDDAYAQIRLLQTPQPRVAATGEREGRFTDHDGDGTRPERRRHRDSDDD